jgi:dUTP pyrophosphatase
MSTILTKEEISGLLKRQPPLVEDYVNLTEQLQPNGIDLTLRETVRLKSPGQIAATNSQRVVSDAESLSFDNQGFVNLSQGSYLVTYNEIINLPDDITALATPRSSLLRCGVTVNSAVWDAGYSGRSQSLLVVYNPAGFRLQQNARILQLIFFRLSKRTQGYRGRYQRENINS